MSLLIIDGDVLCYRAAWATEKTKYVATQGTVINNGPATFIEYFDDAKAAKAWAETRDGAMVWSRKEAEPEENAITIVDVMIRDIKERYATENLDSVLCLSGVGNYRHGIATRANYKGNRAGTPQPVHLRAIREHLISKGAVVSAGEEADDVIGIAATENPGSVVCSIDKDLMQLPGRHYNFVTKEEVTVSKKQAVLNFYAQVLSGDPVDNVPGLTSYGPVKAKKALADCRSPVECWYKALELYTAEFGPEDGPRYARECASLVYVRRKPGEVWAPPNTIITPSEHAA